MTVVSAPGKVTLFGEHAVVYGEPAIAAAINRRVRVEISKRADGAIRVEARDLMLAGFKALLTATGSITLEGESGKVLAALSYVKRAIEVVREAYGVTVGAHIAITSEMPVGAGLGTSAAVAVAVVKAYSLLGGVEITRRECAELGYRVELGVQGSASRMDSTVTSMGGVLYITPRGEEPYRELKVPSSVKGLVVGYVSREASTGEMVARVRRLKEELGEPIDLAIRAIGEVTRKAKASLEKGDVIEVGRLMNVNHGLLEAIGVSTSRLSQMVYAARSAGALGSKITGAGGGGCIIALAPGAEDEVVAALRAVGASAFKVDFSREGVTVEES
ncbi:MAG: mevalonate kinase [Thermoprotei archaeon]|nr:MAG: mevalonate kinase [Thermoprotei archaeon]RLF19190.1 MAG: mevalonate kinase [Thermoprotei archaeon]